MDDSSTWGCEDSQWPLNSSMAAPPPKTGCDLKTTGTLSSQEEVSTGIRQSLSQTKPKPTFSKGFSRTLVRKDQYSKWKPHWRFGGEYGLHLLSQRWAHSRPHEVWAVSKQPWRLHHVCSSYTVCVHYSWYCACARVCAYMYTFVCLFI